ncbi:MAG: T9SS type A sorting domain-containing protein [Flavobacteriales bacterium]|nr:T9SS type A sorting domain-containing protein [Flavobacteriales bacterium]
MVRFIKYVVIGVVLMAIAQFSQANCDEKEKTKTSDNTKTTKADSVIISTIGDIAVGDTLVFDDYDEDDDDAGSISLVNNGSKSSSTSAANSASIKMSTPQPLATSTQTNESGSKSIEDIHANSYEMSAYPNPVTSGEMLSVTHNLSGSVTLIIRSINGNIVKEFESSSQKIEISDLSSGVYFVQISGGTHSLLKKVIVQ